MELINNTTKTLKDDLSVEIKQGSKVSIAAACFSIYAFQELKEQLSQIEQLRFIFTSPTFVTEKAKKERREFYIPRMTRERSLYGTEFEIKLRNELTQKAIARECAEWIRQKVTFKSNSRTEFLSVARSFSDWIFASNDGSLPYDVKLLNKLQIEKRERALTIDEVKELFRVIESPGVREDVLVGAYLLLDQQPAAELHFEKLDTQLQEEFKKYPIFHFWKESGGNS